MPNQNPRQLKKISVPPEALCFDPAHARANAIAREAQERFNKISDRLMEILKEEKVTVVEFPLIISNLAGKVNEKIDGAEIEKILNLK